MVGSYRLVRSRGLGRMAGPGMGHRAYGVDVGRCHLAGRTRHSESRSYPVTGDHGQTGGEGLRIDPTAAERHSRIPSGWPATNLATKLLYQGLYHGSGAGRGGEAKTRDP
jgi:hypothetical protein